MRIRCWYCHKPVSSELPESMFFRAIAVCPECIKASPEAGNHPLDDSEHCPSCGAFVWPDGKEFDYTP